MATLYTELRQEMKRKGVRCRDLCYWLGLTEPSISARMNGTTPWSLPEMYTIVDRLHIPQHKLHIVFPRDGMWAGPLEDPPPTEEQQMLNALKALIRKERAS